LNEVNYSFFLLFLAAYKFNFCYETFSKIAAPFSELPKSEKLLFRRRRGLHTRIPGLEGTLVVAMAIHYRPTDIMLGVVHCLKYIYT
jgi:hypothetical protein